MGAVDAVGGCDGVRPRHSDHSLHQVSTPTHPTAWHPTSYQSVLHNRNRAPGVAAVSPSPTPALPHTLHPTRPHSLCFVFHRECNPLLRWQQRRRKGLGRGGWAPRCWWRKPRQRGGRPGRAPIWARPVSALMHAHRRCMHICQHVYMNV